MLTTLDGASMGDEEHWFAVLKYLTIWGYFTSEVGITRELARHSRPGRYQGCATLVPPGEGA